ncbi:MAG TPA: hypothetical protein ENN13_05090 [Candidatus Altiarchaeales archaeon]|nr:hypothetical protein [Candidatus Altiarchaeales archaeon]
MHSVKELEQAGSDVFRELVLEYLVERGYIIDSVTAPGEKTVLVNARYRKAGFDEPHRILASQKTLTMDVIGESFKTSDDGFTKSVIPVKKIPGEISDYLSSEGVKLIGDSQDPEGAGHKILEKIFLQDKTQDEARKYFDKKGRWFGVWSTRELGEVWEGYTPLGVFRLSRKIDSSSLPPGVRGREWSNTIYVDLNSAEILYLGKSIVGAKPELRSNNLIRKIMDLPPGAINLISPLIEHGELSEKKLSPQEFTFLKQNLPNLMAPIIDAGLARVRDDGMGFISHISLPKIDGERMRIGERIMSSENVETDAVVEEIRYRIKELSQMLSALFNCTTVFIETIYLPYYQCKYFTGNGGIEFARVYTPRFK